MLGKAKKKRLEENSAFLLTYMYVKNRLLNSTADAQGVLLSRRSYVKGKRKSRRGMVLQLPCVGHFVTYRVVGKFPTSPFHCVISGACLPHHLSPLLIQRLFVFVLSEIFVYLCECFALRSMAIFQQYFEKIGVGRG